MIELSVKFVRRLYGAPDSDYSVFAAEAVDFADSKKIKENKYGNFTIAGDYSLDDDEIGNIFKVTIEEDMFSRYPNSYKLIKLHYEFPEDPELQWEYLENSNIVPLRTFMEIQRTFKRKDKILDIITDNPERLEKVKGIGEQRSQLYQRKLLESKDKALLFTEYGDIDGVSSLLINKLVTMRPKIEDTIKAIEKDPFILIEEVDVGFVVADRFREFYGFPMDDRNRILHGVNYYLNEEFRSSGNSYENVLTASRMIAQRLLVSYKEVVLLLAEIQNNEKLFEKYKLKIFGKNITTHSLYNAELTIYRKIKEYMESKRKIANDEKWEKNKSNYLKNIPQTLSEEQDEFLNLINKEQVSVLLGPGGAGKSWIIKIACDLIKESGKTFGLFAPTARAAKVMAEYAGSEAKTIHRGLMPYVMLGEIAPYDVLIVDEFSMVDSELASMVMNSMGINTRLIVIGDSFQLQSVGPGNVLFDLVEYIGVPTIRFTKSFRQAEGSKILDYAQSLRDGTFKLTEDSSKIDDGDIVFINETDDKAKQEIGMKLYSDALSKIDGDHEEIMLLSPVNKGPAGRRILNKRAQSIVNPGNGKNEIVFGANLNEDERRYFRKRDYITVTQNQYDMITDTDDIVQIINGDLGEVSNSTSKHLTFDIDGHSYTINKSEINGLIDHAWSTTIHKSQGGQANDVIIILPENAYFMLNSNMLYTALTRAQVRCYVIGNFKTINDAAKRQANFTRKTMIQLQSKVSERSGEMK